MSQSLLIAFCLRSAFPHGCSSSVGPIRMLGGWTTSATTTNFTRIRLPSVISWLRGERHGPLCLAAFDGALRSGLTTLHDGARCSTDFETKAMAAVDEQFRAFVTSGMSREVTTEITVANTPLQRVSFGLVEAVAVAAKLQDPRVKLNGNGTLQADPMPRLLTIVTVNTSFRGYDASAITASPPEKVRWFAGAVILPDFGVAAGLSFLPIRGVSVNGGVAGLFVKSAEANAIGSAPKDATDPFRLGRAWAAFLGVGYNFK